MSKNFLFNQTAYIDSHPRLKKADDGCCFSLALAWLHATCKYKMDVSYFEKTKVQNRVSRWQKTHNHDLIKKLEREYEHLHIDNQYKIILDGVSSAGKNNTKIKNDLIIRQIQKWGGKRNLILLGAKTSYSSGDVDIYFTSALYRELINNGPLPVYGVILLNGNDKSHALSYTITNELEMIKLFDSNSGEYSFQRKEEFQHFLNRYLSTRYAFLGSSWCVIKLNKTMTKRGWNCFR
ncbi:YopT-type cysteine protease domain-containing protein [Scandinavium sp. H11S7]|uniref:YopT-type cysteine protease domain-containing protein n=1 Tax=Scandinavium hiltneri TaxID=2926519 RepID=A0ABT2E553_9ENTR|nr:YopT-type cysteine protease domain-containing protein [Scandinavium hiltneri]MCS2158689.1 YopT-type cysteine protease domain-containing protein [Scandinavium hiltneri]MCS2163010.1 YopT-type cysteine protease domain-containing protein [Scandinavium hiltneri]